MIHPWSEYRRNRNLTQEEVADHLNVTRQTVIRLEQSLFSQPSTEVLVKLGDLYAIPVGELIEGYNAFVQERRLNTAGLFPNWASLNFYEGVAHPLVHYREEIMVDASRLAFCRMFCVDYAPIADYETNKQRGIPLELIHASADMHWDYAPLESAVAEWRASGRYKNAAAK